MSETIIIILLALILFGNSRYGTAAANWIDAAANRLGKVLRRMTK